MLASLLIKMDQALVVRSVLNRISSEGTNVASLLRVEEIRNASRRDISCVTMPDNRTLATNAGICESFRV